MAICGRCQKVISPQYSLRQLLAWGKLPRPVMCETCRQQFTKIELQTACVRCGRQGTTPLWTCADCERWQKMKAVCSISNQALYQYDATMKAFMQQYKFMGDLRLAGSFQTELGQVIKQREIDSVVVMPVSEHTFAKRGFNQAEGLLPPEIVQCRALQVIGTEKVQQSTQRRAQRMNREQPFQTVNTAEIKQQLQHKRLLIFDDVYTTGRTMHFAAQALQVFEPISLVGFTLAR